MKLELNQKINVLMPSHHPVPLTGTIIALTDEPGKLIGVQFEQELFAGHSCDGVGVNKKCLWVHYSNVITDEQLAMLNQRAQAQAAKDSKKVKSVVIDTNGVVTFNE